MHVRLPTSSRSGRAPSRPAGTQPSRRTASTTSPAPTPPREHEAVAAAQRNLTAGTPHHDDHATAHAAIGHLHQLAVCLVTLYKAQRTLHEGIWDIAAARRDQHDRAKGPWNGYDEQRVTADLTPVLTAGDARIAHLRQRHLDATHEALTDLIPQLTDGSVRENGQHFDTGSEAITDVVAVMSSG
ncbi:hypothetical protein ACIGO6_33970 [Streptomyces sp. NPDC053750]|uniref:hypothetical protein n=1 Tax=Streptomyces sp. NPDC053750 TaxID=3365714 RepID=UPI0037D64B95